VDQLLKLLHHGQTEVEPRKRDIQNCLPGAEASSAWVVETKEITSGKTGQTPSACADSKRGDRLRFASGQPLALRLRSRFGGTGGRLSLRE